MLTKFLDPKNDLAFKRVFGTEKNKDILIQFLNDVLNHQYIGKIQEVTFLDPVQAPEVAVKKQSIVDVLCQDQHGVQYIVEMQVVHTSGFEKRAQYYAAKAYSNQLFSGNDYNELREVIFLAITDFEMFPQKSAIKSDHVILDRSTYEHDLRDFTFTFIDLSKFTKQIGDLRSVTDKWYYYLKHAQMTSPSEYALLVQDTPALKRAYDELERFSWSDAELVRYDQIKKRDRDNAAALRFQLQQAEKQGIEKGIEQGRKEGKKEGKKEGIASGKELAKRSVARQMLAKGMDISLIHELTGLSEHVIRSL